MSMHRTWKTCLGIFFLLTFLVLVLNPASAAGKSKNNDKVSVGVETPPQTHQEKVEQILADTSGPPIDNPGEGYYYKVVPSNGKYIVNYFKNGHKENQSGWIFCGTNECGYGL
jgi:hypothetical protein